MTNTGAKYLCTLCNGGDYEGMKIKPYDYLKDFRWLRLVSNEQREGYCERIRDGLFTPDKRELVARCLGTALSRILSNVRGFDTGRNGAEYFSYLSDSDNRESSDIPFLQNESDICAAQRYYGANIVCQCVRSYRKACNAVFGYGVDAGRDLVRFSYMKTALTTLDALCEQSGVSLQGALKRFAEKPTANFNNGFNMPYVTAQNLFYRTIRDFLREMNWYNFLPVQDYGYKLQNLAHECISLLYIMCYSNDRAAFRGVCRNIYRNWGIKLRGEWSEIEIPDVFKN